MKKVLVILLGLILSIPVFAQEDKTSETKTGDGSEMKTIFGNMKHGKKIPIGYYIELHGGYTRIDQRDVFLPGISGGIILNHHWSVGLTGTMIEGHDLHYRNVYYDEFTLQNEGASLSGGYGGLVLEYILLPNSRIHVSFPLMIGGGNLAFYKDNDYWADDNINQNGGWNSHHHSSVAQDNFFAVEPGVKVVFNVIKKLQLGLGISYRYTPDFELIRLKSTSLNQFNATLSLRFGKF